MDKYAVIGNPVKHSLSPTIHGIFAQQTKQDLEYGKILAPLDRFNDTVTEFIQAGGKGINITVPFKVEAYQLANDHSALARQAGAANTLLFRDDGSIYADNTDGVGLVQDLTHNHHFCLRGKRILVIGAGGAARNIIGALLAQAPQQVMVSNRTESKAQALVTQFELHGTITACALNALDTQAFDLIINASSAGLTGDFPPLSTALINQHTWCYDLVYTRDRSQTAFLHWAAPSKPAMMLDGLGMLVEQAASAFALWRGIHPKTTVVIKQLGGTVEHSSI